MVEDTTVTRWSVPFFFGPREVREEQGCVVARKVTAVRDKLGVGPRSYCVVAQT